VVPLLLLSFQRKVPKLSNIEINPSTATELAMLITSTIKRNEFLEHRVNELLKANNKEVERRRASESKLKDIVRFITKAFPIMEPHLVSISEFPEELKKEACVSTALKPENNNAKTINKKEKENRN